MMRSQQGGHRGGDKYCSAPCHGTQWHPGFWFRDEDIHAIPLDEEQLTKLGFTRQDDNGGVRYLRDSFRVHLPEKGNFSNFEMWWREDRRHFHHQLAVHEFQNMYLDMTKCR